MDLKDHVEIPEYLENLEFLDHLDPKVSVENRDRKDHVDQPVNLVMMDLLDLRETEDNRYVLLKTVFRNWYKIITILSSIV